MSIGISVWAAFVNIRQWYGKDRGLSISACFRGQLFGENGSRFFEDVAQPSTLRRRIAIRFFLCPSERAIEFVEKAFYCRRLSPSGRVGVPNSHRRGVREYANSLTTHHQPA